MNNVSVLAGKELKSYFNSLLAYSFIIVFVTLAVVLFFFAEAFFGTGRAEVRGFFRWLPATMALLVCGLTMRQWARENEMGSIELLMTLPASPGQLVLGKFFGCLGLVAVALGFTLFIPITAEALGDLDWGPVIGGYVGALLMGSAYISIGLFVSSWFRDQFIALLMAALVCGALAFASHPEVLGWIASWPRWVGETLMGIGFWSRFASIERGVIDLRDLLYFVSVTALFCSLNAAVLKLRRLS